MSCQTCKSENIANVGAKCSDMCTVSGPGGLNGEPNYVPFGIGIGGGDYMDFSYCLDCGIIQGEWPKVAPAGDDEDVC
jgi:hypothetical protein